jgi:hypothetical protein
LDYGATWEGLSSSDVAFIQLGDHGDDNDDIVPEFSYPAKEGKPENLKVKKTKMGFDGQEYEEFYDE